MEYTGPLTGPLPKRLVDSVNGVIAGLRSAPLVGPLVRRHLTVVTYTGRRSGRTFSTPVAYRQAGDIVTITVEVPQRKKWWRNFTGEGGPLSMELNGVERAGHAVAAENGKGRVIITVRLSNCHPAGRPWPLLPRQPSGSCFTSLFHFSEAVGTRRRVTPEIRQFPDITALRPGAAGVRGRRQVQVAKYQQ